MYVRVEFCTCATTNSRFPLWQMGTLILLGGTADTGKLTRPSVVPEGGERTSLH